jgi:hypothetical protein
VAKLEENDPDHESRGGGAGWRALLIMGSLPEGREGGRNDGGTTSLPVSTWVSSDLSPRYL